MEQLGNRRTTQDYGCFGDDTSSEKMVAGGRLTASTRFCGVEEQGGKRWFVVRKGGPSSSVERRVPMLDIEEVCEVSAHEREMEELKTY